MSLWEVHRILASWCLVWESRCNHFFRLSTFKYWIVLAIRDRSDKTLGLRLIHLVWQEVWNSNLTHNLLYHCRELVKFRVSFFKFSHNNLACWYQLHLEWLITGHQTCYPACLTKLEHWSLSYGGKGHINSTMVMKSWFYLSQVSINKQINWWNQCVQHMMWFEEVCEISW